MERRERLHKRALTLKEDIDLFRKGVKVRNTFLRQVLDQIEAEDPEDEALRPDAEADFFQHFAWFVERLPASSSPKFMMQSLTPGVRCGSLYIKYCQIFKKLHECYDQVRKILRLTACLA